MPADEDDRPLFPHTSAQLDKLFEQWNAELRFPPSWPRSSRRRDSVAAQATAASLQSSAEQVAATYAALSADRSRGQASELSTRGPQPNQDRSN